MIICFLVVRPRSWKELDSWSFGGRLFRVLFNIFFYNLYQLVAEISASALQKKYVCSVPAVSKKYTKLIRRNLKLVRSISKM